MQTHLGAQEAEAGEPHLKIQTYFHTTKGLRQKVMRYYSLLLVSYGSFSGKMLSWKAWEEWRPRNPREGAACTPSMHSGNVCLLSVAQKCYKTGERLNAF